MSSDIESWPPPDNAAAFESFCLDLWKEIWKDPSAQKNGRSGQPQAGVDVFGSHDGRQIGVQCKQKDGLLHSKLTVTEVDNEAEQAKKFLPALSTFIIATSGPRDAHVQEHARLLTKKHKAEGLFSVEVWAWKDIWHELYQHPELLERIAQTYWPRLANGYARPPQRSVDWRLKAGVCAIACLVLFGFAISYIQRETKPKPHFTLSMRIGDHADSTLFLTNDFLSASQVKRIANLPNGAFVFNGRVDGCIVIPVNLGDSNLVFNFTAENDSPAKVTDLQAAVAFPLEWKCSPDSKWHNADLSLVLSGAWKFSVTNLQSWAVQSPWVLFAGDSLTFPPITNDSVLAYSGPKSKGGFVRIALRSTDFEDIIMANVILFPRSPGFSKPFVTQGSFDSNGNLNFSFPVLP